ncbi:MAG: beta-L-arabinofuranosidase domain-containing protein [Thermoguttaceae bacterium]
MNARLDCSAICFGLLVALSAGPASAADPKIPFKGVPDPAPANEFYPGNREPLAPSPLVKLPVGAVRPRGWLRKQMERMAGGLTGRLHELSRFLAPEGNAWLDPHGEGDKSFWEELPYWLKGFGDLGYLLEDQRIINEARRWIEAALASQREDGYFGPRRNLTHIQTPRGGKPDVWPNMIMLNALQSYYEFSGDGRVLKLMSRYFRWELGLPEEDFLLPFWQHQRASDNLASVYWLYNRTGEPWLLELGRKIHRRTANWTEGVASWHGVNIAQCFRGPAVYFQQARDPKFLAATERNYQTVMDQYGQVPGGLFGADENCRPGYTDPRQAAETCTMVEMMLSDEMLARITGEVKWLDRCEEVAFNSLPASMTADLKALRYLTAPNMALSDRANKAPGLQNSGPMLLFDPRSHRCCQHNVSHGWPYFTEHLWMATAGNGLAAAMYAPCQLKAKVGDGTQIAIIESTDYPFSDRIELTLTTPKPVRFPLWLRVPGWCDAPAVQLNGRELEVPSRSSGYLALERTWQDGDKLVLRLPMAIRLTRWVRNQNSVSVSRGPLTYSLRIGEKIVRVGGTDQWPAVEIHPTTPWNYGLVLDEKDPAGSFEVAVQPGPLAAQPFQVEAAPIELRAKAKKIPGWKLDRYGLVGTLCESPIRSDEPIETVRLIPMGCARLRIASFPVIGTGPTARQWTEPAQTGRHAASHCFERDTVDALSDGLLPRSSGDQSIPRFTWWPRRGTSEWVSWQFDQPKTVSEVEVYWFDDTGRGHCRLPRSWRLEWLDGQSWRPVAPEGPYAAAPDTFNRVRFTPVTAKQVRLVVELQPEFSAGILEWRIK